MTRPTDAELAKLLRKAERLIVAKSGGVGKGFNDLLFGTELGKAADALEADAPEPFEAKVERVAQAIHEDARCRRLLPVQSWDDCSPAVKASYRITADIALRAAGLKEG